MKDALRTTSPLTPALSPLKGAGVAWTTRHNLETRRHIYVPWSAGHCPAWGRVVHTASHPNRKTATSAAIDHRLTKFVRRAPSPLNGERAGVRGENFFWLPHRWSLLASVQSRVRFIA